MPDGGAILSIDFVTVATSHGPRLTKRWCRDATGALQSEAADDAKTFDFTAVPITGLDDLQHIASSLAPTQCLIPGKVKDGVDPHGALRRSNGAQATIEAVAHHWLPVDADTIPAADESGAFDPITDPARAVACVVKQLPPEFAEAACIWQWTSSAGIAAGIRMRLFFWLSRPLTGAEMAAWLKGHPVDPAVYRPAQLIYAAPPVLDGVPDPVAQRTGRSGGAAVVIPPDVITVPQRALRPATEGFEPDQPEDIEKFRRYLRGCVINASEVERITGYWSREGDMETYRIAAEGKDKGLSLEKIVDVLIEELPGGHGEVDREWYADQVDHVFEYGTDPPGCDASPTNEQLFSGVEMPEPVSEPLGEPIDIFGNIGIPPTLTPSMMPNAAVLDYAFDVAERQGVDPVIPTVAMLATLAAAITDEIKLVRKANDDDHKERAHFNGLIVEGVGGGKSPAIKAMTAPLKGVQARLGDQYATQMATHKIAVGLHKKAQAEFEKRFAGEALIGLNVERAAADAPQAPMKPVRRYLVLNDATTEGVRDALLQNPHGLLNEQDEMTGFIANWDAYRHDGGLGKDRAFWLQTDGGGQFFVNRAEKADGAGGGVTVPNLSCCFIGGIQPDKLRELAPTLTDDGFIQRSFVFAAKGGFKELDRPVNQDARTAYYDLVDRLVALGPTRPIRLSVEAHHWREEVEQRAADLIAWPATPSAMKGHLQKWKGKYARLLLLYHVVECISHGQAIECEVSGATAERARDFMLDFVLPQQLRFYTEFFDRADAVKSDARWIAGHVLARKLSQITMSDIKRAYHLDPETDGGRMIHNAMRTLESAGWVSAAEIDLSKRSTRWPVNPLVHERFARRAIEEQAQRAETMRRIAEVGERLKAQGKTRKFSQTFDEPAVW